MATELKPGTSFAGYRIESVVGRGAVAEVYRARDADGRIVALKLLEAAVAHDERFRRRFLRESELAASLHHPCIVSTLGSGEDGGRLYLAMDFVEGADLRRLLRDEGRLDPERAVALVEQAAGALDAAHAAGLVHRDVKPGNILVASSPDGDRAYVCDFGLARHVSSASSLTGDRGFVGTIDYVSPEQIEGAAVDARTDLYSLGCVLYECLTGARPFDRDSELSVVFAHLNEPPPKLTDARPDLPAAFDDVFATALAKSPDDRYASCGELASAARAALRGQVLPRRPKRRRLLLALAATLTAAGATTAGLLLTRTSDATPVTITPTTIGGAKLGDTDVALQRLWGGNYRKSTLDQPANYSVLTYSARALTAFFAGTSVKAVEIATSDSADRTAEGIGPCSTVSELKKAYGKRLKPNPHMTHKGVVSGYTLGRHMTFTVGPLPTPSTVEAVALFSNDLASAGFLAGGPCVPGTANVVAASTTPAAVAVAPPLTRTFTARHFTPRLSVRAPAGWTQGADSESVYSLKGPLGSTSIEFRLDPSAASADGAALSNVSRTADALSAWLRATPALKASAPQGSRLGRPVLTVQSVDIGRASPGRAYLTFRDHGRRATLSTGVGRTRLYFTSIRIGTLVHTLAVAVRSPSSKQFNANVPAGDAIVRSLHVAAVPVQEITALSTQCTQPFGGTCLGEIPAGTHTTRTFKPALTYSIPVGWTNFNDHDGNFGLVPPGGDWTAVDNGKTDYMSVFQRFAPTATRCGGAAASVRSAAAYVRWLLNDPALSVTRRKAVTVGGLSGFVVDLRVRQGWTKTCPWSQGLPAAQIIRGVLPTNPEMIHNVLPGRFVMRLYLLDYKGATLGIEIGEIEGSEKLDAYSALVNTFHFAAG